MINVDDCRTLFDFRKVSNAGGFVRVTSGSRATSSVGNGTVKNMGRMLTISAFLAATGNAALATDTSAEAEEVAGDQSKLIERCFRSESAVDTVAWLAALRACAARASAPVVPNQSEPHVAASTTGNECNSSATPECVRQFCATVGARVDLDCARGEGSAMRRFGQRHGHACGQGGRAGGAVIRASWRALNGMRSCCATGQHGHGGW